MFEDDAQNERIRQEGLAKIGFDPRTFVPYWAHLDNVDQVSFNEYTLRPPLTVDGEPWRTRARAAIGVNLPFVSFTSIFHCFLKVYKSVPTTDELMLFTYRIETDKINELYFCDGPDSDENPCLKSRPRRKNGVFTLPATYYNDVNVLKRRLLEAAESNVLKRRIADNAPQLLDQALDCSRNVTTRKQFEQISCINHSRRKARQPAAAASS
jgi:hypothetical protein